jgi:TraK protein
MRHIKSLLALSSFLPFMVQGVVFHTLDTTYPIHCTFSSTFHNRIIVEEGYVKNVIIPNEELYSIHLEEASGQAFIYTRDLSPQEATFSIITNTGKVQDIQVNFTDRPTEVVILKEEKPLIPEENRLVEQAVEEDLLKKVKLIREGKIPAHYVPCTLTTKEWKPKKGLSLKLCSKLEGPVDVLYIYRIQNCSKKTLTIQEQELQSTSSQWIYLQTHQLKSKQTALCIISVTKGN